MVCVREDEIAELGGFGPTTSQRSECVELDR